MKCSKCGNELKNGDLFCNKCGNKIISKRENENDNNKININIDFKSIFIIIIIIGVLILITKVIASNNDKSAAKASYDAGVLYNTYTKKNTH